MNITQRIKFAVAVVALIASTAIADHVHAKATHLDGWISVTRVDHAERWGININHSKTHQESWSVQQHNLPSG